MKPLYTNGNWKIIKRKEIYSIYRGRELIDSSDNFEEAYSLLDKHKKSIK